ncbi:DUF5666 domain-containing protein [Mangrovicoccus sp. HB161399]|uniref:DUF5666 domain-containing protein n=1 Tax=Mangrovicoccus sp. HB161399 TaxID=2720392 RepID=UPI00155279BA|nr:DUF5666 domain-containing protein [Mangrovicoccus sp. HB161399]
MTQMRRLPAGRAGVAALVGFAAALAGCGLPERAGREMSLTEDRVSEQFCRKSLAGGTAEPEEETDGGLGGTGILGVITAAGELRIDGRSFLYRPEAQVDSQLGAFPVSELRRGDTVMVTAMKTARASCAVGMAHYLPVVGQVSRPGGADGGDSFRVLGAEVVLAAGSSIEDGDGRMVPASALDDGRKVAVSGLWEGTRIRATHVRIIDGMPRVRDSITGPVRVDGNGESYIGSVRVRLPASRRVPGRQVTLDASKIEREGGDVVLGIFRPDAPAREDGGSPAGALPAIAAGNAAAAVQDTPASGAPPPGQIRADAAERWADRAREDSTDNPARDRSGRDAGRGSGGGNAERERPSRARDKSIGAASERRTSGLARE